MAKDRQEMEREFIDTAKEKTGHDLNEWMDIIAASGETRTNAIIKWLKTNHSLNHMQANFLAGIYLNDGKPVFDPVALLAKLFADKEDQRPLYDALIAELEMTLAGVRVVPIKTYVSLEHERVFGCVKINKSNLRVGLDLGDAPFTGIVQHAKGLGAMPNISHMIEISAQSDITAEMMDIVQQAYAHAKP